MGASIPTQRGRLLAILLALTLPLAVVAFAFAQASARDSEARIRSDQLELVQAAAATTEFFVDGNIRSVQSLSTTLRGVMEPSEGLNQQLGDAVTINPRWHSAAVIDSDGIAIGSSIPSFVGLSLADREYFQHVTTTGTPSVSSVLSSRLDGEPLVIVAAPLPFNDGTVGALAVELNRDYLRTRLVGALQITSARVVLLDGNGDLVSDSEPQEGDDRDIVSARWAAVNDEVAGTVEIVLEGEESLLAFAPVPSAGWVATVSQPSSVAFAPASNVIRQRAAILGVSLAPIFGLAWITGGWLNRSYASLEAARVEAERAREEAEAAVAARDEFLSIASHELRNPTAGASGAAQLLLRRARNGSLTSEQQREYLEHLVNETGRLARLVNDLLDVSRLAGGRLALQLEVVDLAELVESAVSTEVLDGRPVTIERRDEPVHVHIDALRIEQVIRNLLENAAKYSPPASSIEVAVEADEPHGVARVRVTDHGIGIPVKELEGLFQPFKRASNVADAHIPGMGLGLYVSRGLVEAHNGALCAESRGEGQGSTFVLTLPVHGMDQAKTGSSTERHEGLVGV